MPQVIIGMILKTYMPKILGIFALMFAGVFASIWFLEGWPAFFASLGIIIVGLIAIPSIIVLGIVKLLKIGKPFKDFITRKISKQELMMHVMQGVAGYMMGEQMSQMFGSMMPQEESKKKKGIDVEDIKDKREDVSNSVKEIASSKECVVTGVAATAGTIAVANAMAESEKYERNNGEEVEEEVDFMAMMDMMQSPEAQKQIQQMMAMMMGQEIPEGENAPQVDMSQMMMMLGGMEENSELHNPNEISLNKNKPDIEDVEIKKDIDKN